MPIYAALFHKIFDDLRLTFPSTVCSVEGLGVVALAGGTNWDAAAGEPIQVEAFFTGFSAVLSSFYCGSTA